MGEVFAGRVELIEPIGQGGMGAVWLAHDRRTDALVAAKVLRHSDAASLLRFVRETSLRVDHPHVVAPLGWVAEDDRVVFTMRLVDGGSVGALVGDFGALPPLLVAELLRQLLDGLTAVHAADLVHRDITPANLLLDATGQDRPHLHLSDFGVAAEVDGPRLTRVSHVVGTMGYLAPEQLTGADPAHPQDMYAVGQVAAEMLTARRPDGRGSGPGPRPLGVPEQLWELVTDLTSRDPDARPDAQEALRRLGDPALAWRPGAMDQVEVMRHVEVPPEWADHRPGDSEGTSETGPGSGSPDPHPAAPGQTEEFAPSGTALLPRARPGGEAAGATPAPGASGSVATPGRSPLTLVLLAVMVVAALVLLWALWGLLS